MTDVATSPSRPPVLRTPPGASPAGERVIVGIGDMKIAQGSGQLITTFALGSCVGLTLWDPETRAGAMLHAMLPASRLAGDRSRTNPYMFVDTGVPATFRACYDLGAEKVRLECRVAGGASTHADPSADMFRIGEKNLTILDTLLEKNNVRPIARDVGGHHSRTLVLDLASGEVTVQTGREVKKL